MRNRRGGASLLCERLICVACGASHIFVTRPSLGQLRRSRRSGMWTQSRARRVCGDATPGTDRLWIFVGKKGAFRGKAGVLCCRAVNHSSTPLQSMAHHKNTMSHQLAGVTLSPVRPSPTISTKLVDESQSPLDRCPGSSSHRVSHGVLAGEPAEYECTLKWLPCGRI